MRHNVTAAGIAALTFALATAAAQSLGLPRIVWWLTLLVAVLLAFVAALLAVAEIRSVQRRWPRIDRLPFVRRAKPLTAAESHEEMNRAIRRESKNVTKERQKRENSIEPAPLTGPERDQLRALIAEGEAIAAPMSTELVADWTGRASQWLIAHGQARAARRLRSHFREVPFIRLPEVVAEGLSDLRVVLAVNTPTPFSLDETPGEALEAWMAVQAIPTEMKERIRKKHAEIEQRIGS